MFEFAAFILSLVGVQQWVSSSVETRNAPPGTPSSPAATPASPASPSAAPAATAPPTAPTATESAAPPAPASTPAPTSTETVDFGVPPVGPPKPPKPYFVTMVAGIQTLDEGKVPDLPARLAHYRTQSVETVAGVRRITGVFEASADPSKSVFQTVYTTAGPDSVERVFMPIDAISTVMSSSPPPMFEILIVPVALVGAPFGRSGDNYVYVS